MRRKGARNKGSGDRDCEAVEAYRSTGSTSAAAKELGISPQAVQYRLKKYREETGEDPYKGGAYQRGSEGVICPLYIAHNAVSITCEGIEDGMWTKLQFADKEKRKEYMYSFCRSKCYKGCAVYKYTAEE